MRPVILKTQTELLDEIRAETGDPSSGGLWTTPNIYRAINRTLNVWSGKVVLPRLYSFTGGFVSGTWQYSVPTYIRGDVEVEIRLAIHSVLGVVQEDDETLTWTTVFSGFLEPDSASGESAVFRFHTLPYTQDGRIKWWAANGSIPTPATLPKTSGALTSSDTSVTITTTSFVSDVGWIKINAEYMSYAGISRTATTVTLSNVQRGLFGSTAASHLTAQDVDWCVGADDPALWEHLLRQSIAFLHESRLHRGAVQDRANHEKMVNHMMAQADSLWRTSGYVTQKNPRLMLDQTALGRMSWM